MRIVIALGGNAITSPDGGASVPDQQAAIASAAGPVAELVGNGHEVVLTHGNGPQVGNLLVKNELTADIVPAVPLDWCGALTQASIGMMLMNALDVALAAGGIGKPTATLVSRTLVDADDPSFTHPTKPIGRYLSKQEVDAVTDPGHEHVEVPGRGWRRVVASPEPLECLDGPAAATMLAAGYLVVCSGGGGIPTVRRANGELCGVEAVIDKDRTAALIASQIGADMLVIATDVDSAVAGWGTPHAKPIGGVTVAELRTIAKEQNFAEGSIGPKVEAVTRFAERSGGIGVITSLGKIAQAVEGQLGTRVVSDQ